LATGHSRANGEGAARDLNHGSNQDVGIENQALGICFTFISSPLFKVSHDIVFADASLGEPDLHLLTGNSKRI
jgi:hypothetical protein